MDELSPLPLAKRQRCCEQQHQQRHPPVNLFAWLPLEILKIILDQFLKKPGSCIRDYIHLASCDKFLQRLVYRDIPKMWHEIDFSVYSPHVRALVTDARLHALLERVQAHQVTKSIVLHRCFNISGIGLLPLIHSSVLEAIDLRVLPDDSDYDYGQTGLVDEVVAGVLTSLLPHNKLTTVKLGRNGATPSEFPFSIGSFLVSFALNRTKKVLQDRVQCSHCHVTLSDRLRNTEQAISMQADLLRCNKCERYSCRPWSGSVASSCPKTKRCLDCREPACSHCAFQCASCQDFSCTDCNSMDYCAVCEQSFCPDACGDVMRCDTCDFSLCDDCGRFPRCDVCRFFLCMACGEDWLTCRLCGKTICFSCLEGCMCDRCGKEQWCCQSIVLLGCKHCRNTLCGECRKEECSGWFCEDSSCKAVHTCQYCGQSQCSPCSSTYNSAAHLCVPPGRTEHGSNPIVGKASCACGKRKLIRPSKGQRFICGWAHSLEK